jgi:HAD superfamily hydrolase (TIGR01509 family)
LVGVSKISVKLLNFVKMPQQAVIFDMDGILIDSEPLWREAEKRVFARVGITLTDAMCRSTAGLRIDDVVRHWLGVFNHATANERQLTHEVVQELVRLVKAEGQPMPGARECVAFFKSKGWKIGLASSSWMQIIDAVLERLEIREDFEAVFSAEPLKYGKPHPEVYLQTAEALGVKPEDCLVIEDSFNGALAGLAARMQVVVIPEPENYNDERFKAFHLKFDSLLKIPPHYEAIQQLFSGKS